MTRILVVDDEPMLRAAMVALFRARGFDVHEAETPANVSLSSADVSFSLPLSRLAAGHYLLIVEGATASATVRRNLRFDVK
jgi:CheY-like chemotaxis protein